MNEPKFRDKTLTLRERINDLLERLTTEEKIYMLSTHQRAAERLGVGEWHVGCEAARGFVSREEGLVSTVFPQPVGMASTFDKELMRKIGEIAGEETRYYYRQEPTGKLMLWGPTVDMERNPLWGRTEEGYGEDTCLAGEMTREYTIGLAGSSRNDEPKDRSIYDCTTEEEGVLLRTIPTLKHFCANNNEEGRGDGNADVTEKLLHEYYYRAFMPALSEGGAHSAMAAYNKIGGIPGDMNPDIQRILKDKWGMDFAVTDGGAFTQNLLSHRVVRSHGESLAVCLKNGMDVMTDNEELVAAAAHEALSRGLITEEDIDRAVRSSLLGRFRLGEFDGEHKYTHGNITPDSEYCRSVNLRASLEQICLLKNNGTLPLDREKTGSVLIAGPIGDENYKDWYTGTASYAVSIRAAFEKEPGAENVLFDNGWDIIALRSVKTGKYMSVSDSGEVLFAADTPGEREMFELHCWDESVWNFKSLYNGRYVTEKGSYRAESDTPYSWFIREWFKPQKRGKYYSFDSWHDEAVFVDGSGRLCVREQCRVSEDRLFAVEIISRGADRLKELSEKADKVICCVGNHPMQVARECYDRHTLMLPAHQHEMVMCIPAEKLILAVIASYPYAIGEESAHSVAVLYSTHCGAELGNAVYKTVFGENNPAARCPITWYADDGDIPPITEYNIIRAKTTYMYFEGEPLYCFGHGLSYSRFEYGGIFALWSDKGLCVSLNVKNASEKDGDEVVQIYFSRSGGDIVLRLCGFERVHIRAGETKKLSLLIPRERLCEYDPVSDDMKVCGGTYRIMAGASSKDIRLTVPLDIPADRHECFKADEPIPAKRFSDVHNAELDFSFGENDRYLRFGDWGGSAVCAPCDIHGCTAVKIWAAAPLAPAGAELLSGGTVIGRAEFAPTVSPDAFKEYTIPLSEQTDIRSLTVKTRGAVNIYKLKFICK